MTDCSLIRDLLPLYADDAVSEESRTVIESHLAECKECRSYYRSIRRIPHSLQHEENRGDYNYSEIADSLKREMLATYALGAGLITLSTVCVIKSIADSLWKK